jgi:hypothetical protein
MPMIVTCPCGRQLQLDEQYAGTRVRCPICQQIFQAPGRDIGDFQMENSAPPSEPMPASPRLAASVPAGWPDPSVFDLAPSPPRASAPVRPHSRPVVRHGKEVGPSRRSWPVLRMFDLCAGVLLLGAVIALVVSLHHLAAASAPSAGGIVGVLLGAMLTIACGLWFFFRLVLIFRR